MKIISVCIFSVTSILTVSLPYFIGQIVQAATKDALCLTDREFATVNTMDLSAIRAWLDGQGGYIKGTNADGTPFTFTDVDGNTIDPAKVIFEAATVVYFDSTTNQYLPGMNPQVLLTTLYKEQPSVFRDDRRPDDKVLKFLAGWGTPSASARAQIEGGARQLRRDFYARLALCTNTLGNWQVDTARQTGEPNPGDEIDAAGNPISVSPENKTVAALYTYTPWIGPAFGGGRAGYDTNRAAARGRGGNGYFCQLWKDKFQWELPPSASVSVTLQKPTLYCSGSSKCISLNASGGTPPYTWSSNKGNLTVTGVNLQNAKLRPPTNNGGYPGGLAYNQGGMNKFCADTSSICKDGRSTQGCAASPIASGFGCSDQYIGAYLLSWACGNMWGMSTTYQTCYDSFGSSRPVRGTCYMNFTNCYGQNYNQVCSGTGAELFTDRKDRRTAAMISSGCRPCSLEMQGATVTATDANLSPVTVNVSVK